MTRIPGGAPAGFGGEVSGDRLKGSIAPSAGGDWLLIGQDGYGRLDVRNTVVTVDDACIYIQLHGLVELTPVAEAYGREAAAGAAVPVPELVAEMREAHPWC